MLTSRCSSTSAISSSSASAAVESSANPSNLWLIYDAGCETEAAANRLARRGALRDDAGLDLTVAERWPRQKGGDRSAT